MTLLICPRCQAPLPLGTPSAQCPRCLLRLGFDTGIAGSAPAAERRPPPTKDELAPDFPQLEILELLGQGGMGAVYRARQRSLDRVVALKVLTVDVERDPDFAARFTREARALAALDHPSIVRVHDSGQAGGRFYLLMEYVDGTDLRRMLRSGRIAPREALSIVSQVCDALQYAHDQGVVHRDIKPENLLVDRRGRVKIADFGLAKLVGRAEDAFALTGSHQAMGTPHYMAPEQIERPQEVDHRADIYSLGVVLYELLTGELPLGRFVPPSKRVEVDVRLDEVVLKALEKDLPRRYQHASEVKNSLEGLTSAAPPHGRNWHFWRKKGHTVAPTKNHPVLVGCLAALVFGLVAFGLLSSLVLLGRSRGARLDMLQRLAEIPELGVQDQERVAQALLEGDFEKNAARLIAFIERQELAPEVVILIRHSVEAEDPSADKDRVLAALEREGTVKKP
jgi:predicted Ser/Thr protein kinase